MKQNPSWETDIHSAGPALMESGSLLMCSQEATTRPNTESF